MADNPEDFRVDYQEDSLSLFLKVVRFCARDPCPKAVGPFFQNWHYILRALHVDPSCLQSMIESIEKRQAGEASHATLLTAFKKESVVLITRSIEVPLKGGYSSFKDGKHWEEYVYVKADESVTFLQDPNSQSMKGICIHTPNLQVSFISHNDETPTRIEVVGPRHFSRQSTTIEISDSGIQMSLVDLTWIISCLCQNDSSSEQVHEDLRNITP
jgi:hypothetical protein